jgi:hypothetical protein
VRAQLRALLEAGVNPLTYFDRDYKKYFYLAGVRGALLCGGSRVVCVCVCVWCVVRVCVV